METLNAGKDARRTFQPESHCDRTGVLDALTSAITVTNEEAKTVAARKELRRFYVLKDQLLSVAICSTSPRKCQVSYQIQTNGQVSVLVTLTGSSARTFHQSFAGFAPKANAQVFNRIGLPAVLVGEHERQRRT
jgi:ribosomal protein L5